MSEVTITAAMVGELRGRTGAGMMECKRALQEVQGDLEAAIESLRKSGQAKADKKADRAAAEGSIVIAQSGDKVVMLEINCETDFVGRDENFTNFAKRVTDLAVKKGVDSLAALSTTTFDSANTVEEARQALVIKTGENINVRRITLAVASSGTTLGFYVHGAGRIGVLVTLKQGNELLAKDIAMHIAAADPAYLSSAQVPADVIVHEKSIMAAQPDLADKPAEMVAKITEGRIKKWLQEVSLLDQSFVKDPTKSIQQLLTDAKAEIISFVRYKLGESI